MLTHLQLSGLCRSRLLRPMCAFKESRSVSTSPAVCTLTCPIASKLTALSRTDGLRHVSVSIMVQQFLKFSRALSILFSREWTLERKMDEVAFCRGSNKLNC